MAEDDSDQPMSADEMIASAQEIIDQSGTGGAKVAFPSPSWPIRCGSERPSRI